uniref:Zinc finger CHCC-type domain-containing protein n=1 Tax=Photinus pyralis TaxID=7054 RepID=A0A1Y1KJY7_PHOPY
MSRFQAIKNLILLRRKSDWIPKDPITHTGQQWDKDDYRLARFINRPKHVNPNFAIKLVAQLKPICTRQNVVCCDGGGALGHPKIYLNLDKPGLHACMYCGQTFMQSKDH